MSMIQLHGTWNPSGGYFFVWGEDRFRYGHRPRRPVAQKSTPKHPFQAPLGELDVALGRPDAAEATHTFLLPTGAGPRPIPSPDLSVDLPPGSADSPCAACWNVTGLALEPAVALPLLVTLPTNRRSLVHAAGSDLFFWSQAAKLTLELLVRQQFLPTVDVKRSVALWRLVLTEAEDRRRVDELAAAMPWISRSILPGKTDATSFRPPDPHGLLTHFMESAADVLIRHWLADYRQVRWAPLPLAEEWVSALAAPAPTMLVTGGVDRFADRVRAWSAPVTSLEANPFLTCFRLDTPPDDSADDEPWLLDVMLQSVNDPSLLIPAAALWREQGDALHHLPKGLGSAQEQLLIDLTVAARLFPPIRSLLESARPSSCALLVADAYRFLSEGAPLLQESGMAVLMPAAFQEQSGLKVRARVKAPRSATAGGLGLAQILDVDWDLVLGDQPVTVAELQRIAKLKVPLVRVRGQWVAVDSARVSALLKRLSQRGGITVGDLLKLSAGMATESMDLPLESFTAEGVAADLLERLRGQARPVDLSPPGSLQGQLRPYQVRGLSWLSFLRSYGVGACLADDMGLGKTVQVIALLLHAKELGQRTGPVLLLCPTSLVGNWQREIARFGPSLQVLIHHGSDRLRGPEFSHSVANCDVVISTYALIHRDLADLAPIAWEGIILDEAQNIKNAETRQSKSLRQLSVGYRIALTGTPVENRLGELWSLMSFLNPGYLGSAAEFHRRFAVPIERYRDGTAAARLRQLVQPFILRRVKTDPAIIDDLPAKIDQPVYINLTPEQASLYAAVVADMLARIEASDGMERRGLVLATLAKLKQICNHPAHFLMDGSPIGNRSGKVNRLAEMLDEVLAEGDRALIFTQFAEMGHLLAADLTDRFGQEVLFLHGGLSGTERVRMVERFQGDNGPAIFILTLKAGGVGLNLTRANHVFHFDRWWNPAVENQATDRAFRIGQQRNVMVHRLITAGSIEEKIDAMIEAKRQLAEQVVTAGEEGLTELSTEQLRAFFTLEKEA